MEDYEYPYGEMQVHEALEDLDRRLKALEPKSAQKTDAPKVTTNQSTGQSVFATGIEKPVI